MTERLLETYARAAAEIAEVLAEAVQSTRRVAAWNASGVGPWIAEPPQLQRGVRLPPERVGEAAFWPPMEKLDVAAMIPAEMAKREEAIGPRGGGGDEDRVAS